MTKEEWLQRMRELVSAMPTPESIDLHKGRKGIKRAFSKLNKGVIGSTLSEIVGLLKEWDQAGLSESFDPADDGQRATAARLSGGITAAGGRWLTKHGGEDQAGVIESAVEAARAVTAECARFEQERDAYIELLGDLSARSTKAVKAAADVVGLGLRLSAVLQAQMPTLEKAQAGLYVDATRLLPAWRDAVHALEQGQKAYGLYLGRMQPIDSRSIEALKTRARFDPTPVDRLKDKIAEARTLVLNTAKSGLFEDARGFCDSWEEPVDELLVLGAQLEMAVPPPDDPTGVKSEDQVKRDHYAKVLGDLGKLPGGSKAIKALVKELDPEAESHGVILQCAVQEAYGVELKQLKGFTGEYEEDDETWEESDQAKEVQKTSKKLFKLLGRVPESHVKGNPMFDKILNFEENTGGAAYWSTTKAAYMHCGRSGKDGSSRQGREVNEGKIFNEDGVVVRDFFPDGREEDCQPANDDEVPYFNWATLHEVGHAVDAACGFMDTNASDPAFGGWQRESRRSLSKVAAAHFDYPRDWIREVLNTKALPAEDPDCPDGVELVEWQRRKQACIAWLNAVLSKKLWWDGAASKTHAIDGRVYQESYDGDFTSYLLAARTQGIHGYQFRAPAEWFAELYAAYYCDKLKPSHPFVPELQKLDKAEKLER